MSYKRLLDPAVDTFVAGRRYEVDVDGHVYVGTAVNVYTDPDDGVLRVVLREREHASGVATEHTISVMRLGHVYELDMAFVNAEVTSSGETVFAQATGGGGRNSWWVCDHSTGRCVTVAHGLTMTEADELASEMRRDR